jgi:hypothetical protein
LKFVLLLPLNYNDGTVVPRRERNRIGDEIFEFADGYAQAGEVVGAYRMKDRTKQVDRSLVIWIGVQKNKVPALRRLVAKFARELGQESLYLERTGSTIEFVRPLPPEDDT